MREPAITQCCFSRSWGGLEMYVPMIAKRIMDDGWPVQVLGREGAPLVTEALRLGIPTVAVRDRLVKASLLDRSFAPPALIHAHRTTDLAHLVIPLRRKGRPSVVLHRHIGASREKKDPWHRYLFGKVDRFIAITYYIASQMRDGYAVDPGKVVTLHYGLDAERFIPGAYRGQIRRELGVGDIPLVGCLSRLDPQKGQRALIRAMRIVIESFPDAQLLLVGEETRNEEGERAVIRSLITEKRLGDHVHLLGFRGDIPRIIDDLDVVVMPSLKEAFGLVALESMAMGKPVIAPRSRGVPEIVHDGETGLLVPPGEVRQLGEAITALLADRGKAEIMGKNGRERFLSHFTLDFHVERLKRIYRDVVHERA